MALLGKAAMLLSFDIATDAITEHDDWHTHEHFPERLSIPGFLRGSRWIAQQGQPRYFVLYEVEAVEVLASAAYIERLNHPTPWTAKMMAHYRGMTRGLCTVRASFGLGLGQAALLTRFKPEPGKEDALRKWLVEEALAPLPSKPGLASAHLFEGALAAPSTKEQSIRGKDAAVDWAVVVTGYDARSVAALGKDGLGAPRLAQRGAAGIVAGVYGIAYTLSAIDVHAAGLRS